MKNLLIISLLVLFSSCLSTRKVNKEREQIKLIEKAQIERKAPGDRVYIEFPRIPNERPKSTTTTYKGEKGARVDVGFDSTGQINRVLADCPQVDEKEERQTEFERNLKLKQTEMSFNLELAKEIKSTIIWVAAIFAVAWVLRKRI